MFLPFFNSSYKKSENPALILRLYFSFPFLCRPENNGERLAEINADVVRCSNPHRFFHLRFCFGRAPTILGTVSQQMCTFEYHTTGEYNVVAGHQKQ